MFKWPDFLIVEKYLVRSFSVIGGVSTGRFDGGVRGSAYAEYCNYFYRKRFREVVRRGTIRSYRFQAHGASRHLFRLLPPEVRKGSTFRSRRRGRRGLRLRAHPLRILQVPAAAESLVKLDDHQALVEFGLGKIALGGEKQ